MRLPPLNALRAFEAAARHQGFILAAEELCVTRGAISRQVKLLEDHLGVALFHRHVRGVALTTAGRQLQPVLSEAFQMMMRQVEQIAADAAELRVICPPTLSIRWLLPQLEAFRAAYPEISLRLTTDFYSNSGFAAADFDLGISLQNSRLARAETITVLPLFDMRLAPACAPALLPRLEAGPEALAQLRLLHESPRQSDWATWARHFGLRQLDVTRGEIFPNLDMATRAAVMGAGVVMADLVLCAEELARGDLVLPFPQMSCGTPEGAYALIGEAEKWHDPKVAAFRDWLLAGPCAAAQALLPA